MDIIDSFRGKYRFLSNFYERRIFYKNHWFPTSEHAYQSEKSLDKMYRTQLMTQEEIDKWNVEFHKRYKNLKYLDLKPEFTAMEAKRWGNVKRITPFGLLRPDWFDVSIDIMYDVVKAKFTQHEDLKKKLLDTGNILIIEGNNWGDDFWGMIKKDGKWFGKNYLGKILMRIRKELREGII